MNNEQDLLISLDNFETDHHGILSRLQIYELKGFFLLAFVASRYTSMSDLAINNFILTLIARIAVSCKFYNLIILPFVGENLFLSIYLFLYSFENWKTKYIEKEENSWLIWTFFQKLMNINMIVVPLCYFLNSSYEMYELTYLLSVWTIILFLLKRVDNYVDMFFESPQLNVLNANFEFFSFELSKICIYTTLSAASLFLCTSFVRMFINSINSWFGLSFNSIELLNLLYQHQFIPFLGMAASLIVSMNSLSKTNYLCMHLTRYLKLSVYIICYISFVCLTLLKVMNILIL